MNLIDKVVCCKSCIYVTEKKVKCELMQRKFVNCYYGDKWQYVAAPKKTLKSDVESVHDRKYLCNSRGYKTGIKGRLRAYEKIHD